MGKKNIEQRGTATEAETIKKVYIGPSAPYTDLRNARILEGTESDIQAFVERYKEDYPEAAYLLATPEELPGMMVKVSTKGNILHKYYQDMAAKVAATSRKKV